MVKREIKASWTWFLGLLNRDISPHTNVSWTIISDQQKRLEAAMKNVLPHCVHRFCVRHHHNNFKKQYGKKSLRICFGIVLDLPLSNILNTV